MASSLAIALAWRRRSKWEPSEEDISGGPAKVGGLLAAVALAVIWSQLISPDKRDTLTSLALWAAAVTLACLLAYGFLVAVSTYRLQTPSSTLPKNIIGGLWLTEEASKRLKKKPPRSLDELLAEIGVERTWPRSSRALSKTLFVTMYLGLTVAGSVALTCAGALVLLANNPEFRERPECYNKDFHNLPLDRFSLCAGNWSQLGTWPFTLSVNKTSQGFFFAGGFSPYNAKKPFRYLIPRKTYVSELKSQTAAGFRPEHVSILNTDEGLRFTAIWIASEGEDYKAELDLSFSQFETLDKQYQAAGFVLTDLSVYQDSGTRLAAIWVRRANEGYKVAYDLQRPQFESELRDSPQHGYQLRFIVPYVRGSEYLYGAIWEKNVSPWYFEYDLKGTAYQDYYNQQVKSGHHLHQIVAYGDFIASIWLD